MKAIRVQEVGDPDVLQCVDLAIPEPGAGEARVKIEVAGVNFIDTYHRRGWYPMQLPFTPGVEGAGIVDAVGEGVTEVAVGDAVAYGMSTGSYAEYAIVPSKVLVHRGAGVDAKHGTAAMIQGMTAHYLACSTYPLKPGDTCLVHAAAGGTGALLVQIAKLRGARRARHSIDRREGAYRAGGRGRRHDTLYRSGLCRSGAGPDRWRRR